MAKSEETKVPGLEPGAKVRDAEGERYSSPPLSYPDAPRLANSPAAMMLQMKEEIMAELRNAGVLSGDKAQDPAKQIEEAAKREQERRETRTRELQERYAQMVNYKARGNDPSRPAGEIPSEMPGMGRRLVMQGQTFRFGGVPGSWMEPLDDEAKKRSKDEEQRREEIRVKASQLGLTRAALQQAVETFDESSRNEQRRAAYARDFRAGSGG
jgi:hypothetical protein